MIEGPYLLGVDGGTEGVRVGVFDREHIFRTVRENDFEPKISSPPTGRLRASC